MHFMGIHLWVSTCEWMTESATLLSDPYATLSNLPVDLTFMP